MLLPCTSKAIQKFPCTMNDALLSASQLLFYSSIHAPQKPFQTHLFPFFRCSRKNLNARVEIVTSAAAAGHAGFIFLVDYEFKWKSEQVIMGGLTNGWSRDNGWISRENYAGTSALVLGPIELHNEYLRLIIAYCA